MFSTVTDTDGHYVFPPLPAKTWTVTVEIFGFDTITQEVNFGDARGPVNFTLQLKPSQTAQRLQRFMERGATQAGSRAGASQGAANQQLEQEIQNSLNAGEQNFNSPNTNAANGGANEAFLVSGSLSPGMASGQLADSGPAMRPGFGGGDITGQGGGPAGFGAGQAGGPPGGEFGAPGGGGPGGGFGGGGRGGFGGGRGGPGGFGGRGPGRGGVPPPGAVFGNRRRRTQQIHGQASYTLQNSAVNAKPFSLNGLDIPQSSYAQSRFSFIIGGPLVIPKLIKDPKTQFFITYFGTRASTPDLFTETVPTAAQRAGDFSQTTQSLGTSATNVPVTIFQPGTNTPFPGNRIPTSSLNPIALGLLNFYRLPNQAGTANNFQDETVNAANSNNFGVRLQRSVTNKDRLSVNFQFQNRDGTTAQWYGVSDRTNGYGLNTQLQWTRNLTANAINNAQVRFNRNKTQINPYFAMGSDIATELGIPGVSQVPANFGPPTLTFTNFASLSDSVASLVRNQSQSGTESITLLKGTHSVTLGVSYTRADLSTVTDPNGRGTFSFTGSATSQPGGTGQAVTGTGYDLADFLLGYTQSTSIRYGTSSNYFLQNQYVGYAQDEWKARANLTLTAGVRYEFFTPFSEKYGHMANLDIAPGFTNVSVVTPNQGGPYTGFFPSGLIDGDHSNWAPRLALAWKAPTRRSTVVRAGYGIYYNEQAYVSLAENLAQQPPFAKSYAVNSNSTNRLTLNQGFTALPAQDVTNTFAVDRFYRTPYAGTWNLTVQHDFGAGFFVEAGYLGTKGTHLDVSLQPNSVPPGVKQSTGTQLGNATGFIYDQPVGNSIFNAFQLRAVRRFNHGLSFNSSYQFAKSIDDTPKLGGIGVAGAGNNSVVQNWLDIAADRGLSAFDVRHEGQATFVWTSPVAGPGSSVPADSKLGRFLKDWQLSGGITAQTGNPLTPRVLSQTEQLAQTGGTGSQRAEATGQAIDSGNGFFNLNAFTTPAAGTYGNAGRNTIPGPGTFAINLAFARSFTLSESSRRRIEFRVEANNVLNHVNYSNLYTVVNAVNYGLPSAAASMRSLDAVVRFRF